MSWIVIGAESKTVWNLKRSYAVLAGYVVLFPFLWNLSTQHNEAFTAQMAFHFVASLCGLYIVVRTSKLVSHLELNRSPRFREYGKLMGSSTFPGYFHRWYGTSTIALDGQLIGVRFRAT